MMGNARIKKMLNFNQKHRLTVISMVIVYIFIFCQEPDPPTFIGGPLADAANLREGQHDNEVPYDKFMLHIGAKYQF